MVVLCGSTAAVGTAEKVDGGYRVNGRWQFVSGCHNASLFSATVNLVEDGERGQNDLRRLFSYRILRSRIPGMSAA